MENSQLKSLYNAFKIAINDLVIDMINRFQGTMGSEDTIYQDSVFASFIQKKEEELMEFCREMLCIVDSELTYFQAIEDFLEIAEEQVEKNQLTKDDPILIILKAISAYPYCDDFSSILEYQDHRGRPYLFQSQVFLAMSNNEFANVYYSAGSDSYNSYEDESYQDEDEEYDDDDY